MLRLVWSSDKTSTSRNFSCIHNFGVGYFWYDNVSAVPDFFRGILRTGSVDEPSEEPYDATDREVHKFVSSKAVCIIPYPAIDF